MEDFLVETLAKGDYRVEYLHTKYNETATKAVTIQALYKSLKKLSSDEIVVKHKDTFSINNLWKKRVTSLLQSADSFPQLKEGESITYSFKSFEQLDEYWKHIQGGAIEKSKVTYFFCPHQFWWFVPGRRASEVSFYESFKNEKREAVLLLGSNTKTDNETKKLIMNDHVQVHTEKDHGLKMTDSLTIKNDLIIITRIPFAISNKINDIYNQNLPYSETEKILADLFKKRIPVRILVERNKKKSEKLTKQIGKYFFIKN